MGARSLVGVLGMYATMDTSQFTAALKQSGNRAKAWAFKVKGGMNSISGSVTELSAKLGVVAQGLKFAQTSILGAADAFKLFTSRGVKADEAYDSLVKTLRTMPAGLGEIFGSTHDWMDAYLYGDLVAQGKRFSEQAKIQEERAKRLNDEIKQTLSMRKELIKLEQKRMIVASGDPDEAIRYDYKNRLDAMREEMRGIRRSGLSPQRQKLYREQYLEQLRLLNQITDERLDAASLARTELEQAKKVTEQLKLQSDYVKTAAEAEKQALDTAKSLGSLRDRINKQQTRVDQSGGFQGTTYTLQTALGSYKVANEAQTLVIAKQALREQQEEVKVLNEIKKEMIDVVGGILT